MKNKWWELPSVSIFSDTLDAFSKCSKCFMRFWNILLLLEVGWI